MPYNHSIPDAPIAPSMLPRVAAADLTSQDVLILTQPGTTLGRRTRDWSWVHCLRLCVPVFQLIRFLWTSRMNSLAVT